MEFVTTAVKSTFRKLSLAYVNGARRWSLRLLRNLIWRADEWVHAQEVAMRQEATTNHESRITNHEFDPAASAARERATVRARRPRHRGMTAAEFDARFVGARQ
jgi:hypothetical protein